jgi:hypothetical protein
VLQFCHSLGCLFGTGVVVLNGEQKKPTARVYIRRLPYLEGQRGVLVAYQTAIELPGLPSIVILSNAKDLCTPSQLHRSFAADNAAQDDNA